MLLLENLRMKKPIEVEKEGFLQLFQMLQYILKDLHLRRQGRRRKPVSRGTGWNDEVQ